MGWSLAFACSLRLGEILGLTWKNVHIEDEDIAADNAYIYIEAELERASKRAIEAIGQKDIYRKALPDRYNHCRLLLPIWNTSSILRNEVVQQLNQDTSVLPAILRHLLRL